LKRIAALLRHVARALACLSIAALLAGVGAAQGQQKSNAAKGGPPAAKPTPNSPAAASPAPQRQRELQRQQRDLQTELATVKRQLAAKESTRSEATDALASSELAISQVNRRLHELARARERLEQQLAALEARERDVAHRAGEKLRQLDWLLREQHRLGLRDPLDLLLEGGEPDRLARDATYLGYLARDTEAYVSQLQVRRLELAALHDQTEQKRVEIAKLAEDETKDRQSLEREQARRKRALDQLAKEIAGQRQSIARLERDEQRLGALIDQISRVLAEQARIAAERERRLAEKEAAAKRAARPAKDPKRREDDAAIAPTVPIGPFSAGNFAQQKGKLTLPVQGAVTHRFGSARRGDGGPGGPTWKGVFVQAPAGVQVRSVGDGQIVFADWLRGFGNLLVIDHGDGYLSIYGNNEAVLRNVGDQVAVGDVVASVGNTGGSEVPGLYFELRFQGRPFDPLGWVAAR
jgi:septal ring factor EnvC (AmiA/AmiB activator)